MHAQRRTGRQGQRLGALDGQHIRQLAGLQPAAQPAVGAVDLLGSHPAGRHPSLQGAVQHHPGQLGLGREPDPVGDAGDLAALGVSQPPRGRYSSRSITPCPVVVA
jgi:hypothetical protein